MRSAVAGPAKIVHVVQGDFKVSSDPECILTAVLGSCVSACLWDPDMRVGGMNHMLLPEATASASDQVVYGAQSMELLINALLKGGASKSRLEAKLFGGSRMIEGLSDIGEKNAAFARRFLREEGIPCIAESLGGTRARRVRFWPTDGRARQMMLGAATEIDVRRPTKPRAGGNDVELF